MKVISTAIPEVLVLEPKVFGDARGFFSRASTARCSAKPRRGVDFVQDNHSRSARACCAVCITSCAAPGQARRVVRGAVFDVAVDVRRSSPRSGKWVGEV
jgi:dTDP-4-dehydrorhamnose 3,5-epimerase